MNQKEVNDLCERKPTESQTVVELQSALRRIDILEAKLLASEAGGAEMRKLLENINKTIHGIIPDSYYPHILHALSTTCGQSFLKERERHVKALEEIAGYGKDGICPYGCDCPNIAHTALNPQ